MLPYLADAMSPELWFCKRQIKFINMGLKSTNKLVRTIMNMSLYGTYSVIGGNYRLLLYKFDMNVKEIHRKWEAICQDESLVIRQAEQVKELCIWRDSNLLGDFSSDDINAFIDFLCTN